MTLRVRQDEPSNTRPSCGTRRRRVGPVGPILLALGLIPGQVRGQDPRQIVEHVDRLMQAGSSQSELVMEIETANWSRTLELAVWSLGTDNALVRVLAPARERGTVTLKSGDQIWNYLPRVDRTIRVPRSLMGGSWMGSHLTNDDLVRDTEMADEYEIALRFSGERDGVRVWEIVLTPQPEAPVVWGRVEMRVRQEDMMPVWLRYYDEDGELARTMSYHDYRVVDGRLIPTRVVTRPADKPDEYTAFHVRWARFDLDLDAEFFSLRNLRVRE